MNFALAVEISITLTRERYVTTSQFKYKKQLSKLKLKVFEFLLRLSQCLVEFANCPHFLVNISCQFSFHLLSLRRFPLSPRDEIVEEVKWQFSCNSEILATFKDLPMFFFVTAFHSKLNFRETEMHVQNLSIRPATLLQTASKCGMSSN